MTNTSISMIAGAGVQCTVDSLRIVKGTENTVNNVFTLRYVRGDECSRSKEGRKVDHNLQQDLIVISAVSSSLGLRK